MKSLWKQSLIGNFNPQSMGQPGFEDLARDAANSGLTFDTGSMMSNPGLLKTPISLSSSRLVGPPINPMIMPQQNQQRPLMTGQPLNPALMRLGSYGVR